jgi:hypothetical protein
VEGAQRADSPGGAPDTILPAGASACLARRRCRYGRAAGIDSVTLRSRAAGCHSAAALINSPTGVPRPTAGGRQRASILLSEQSINTVPSSAAPR